MRRIRSYVMTFFPYQARGLPFPFLSSPLMGPGVFGLPYKSRRIRNLPHLFILDFRCGAGWRKPLIYALPDRSIVRSFDGKFELSTGTHRAKEHRRLLYHDLQPWNSINDVEQGEDRDSENGKCQWSSGEELRFDFTPVVSIFHSEISLYRNLFESFAEWYFFFF